MKIELSTTKYRMTSCDGHCCVKKEYPCSKRFVGGRSIKTLLLRSRSSSHKQTTAFHAQITTFPPIQPRRQNHLDHHFAPSEKLLHLLGDLVVACVGFVAIVSSRLVLLELQVCHGSINAADLPVRPALHPVTPAQPLKSRHRYVHRLTDKTRQTKKNEKKAFKLIVTCCLRKKRSH